ncbi:MAG TPA: DNA repair protein RadC [Anaerolineales bacterium]|nr:DNA repair protein RadC [Anaerolineales bacterium]
MSDRDQSYRIRDLPAQDRPRERLIALGPQALSHAELLALLVRVGARGRSAIQVGQDLLQRIGGLAGLQRAVPAELCRLPGVGPSKACTLLAAIELGRRIASLPPEDRPSVASPAQAAALVQYEMSALDQEHLRVLLLDTRNRLVRIAEVYRGSLNTSLVRIGEVFREALRHNAAGLIVVHNHPSGDPSPSPEDVALTRSLVEAGKLLDLQVLDHLIIGQGRFVSLRERGLGFAP